MGKKVTFECDTCKNEMERPVYTLAGRVIGGRREYCSTECVIEDLKETPTDSEEE